MNWLWQRRLEVVALAAGALHLRFARWPMTPDEAGFVLVARHWQAGSSLYGNYWVDRPPGLIALYQVAWQLAGPLGITLLAVAATTVTVWVIGRLALLVQPDHSPLPALVVVGAMMNSRLFAASESNGELLATPFVVAAVWAMLKVRSGTPAWWQWTAAAGALAVTAAMVKQNFIDAAVFALTLLALDPVLRGRRLRLVAVAAAGGLGCLAVLAGLSAVNGTPLADLPYAIVGFRLDAIQAVSEQALYGPSGRPAQLLLILAASGIWLSVVAGLWQAARPSPNRPVLLASLAMLTWEGLGLVAGGGYWTHYAMGLTAGVGCLMAVADPPRIQRLIAAATVACLLLAPLALLRAPWKPARADLEAAKIGREVRRSAQQGDTLVVIIGSPNIAYASGLESPYPYLWKPVQTLRDPHFDALAELLASPEAPDLVLIGDNDPAYDSVVAERYEPVREIRGWALWRLTEPAPQPESGP